MNYREHAYYDARSDVNVRYNEGLRAFFLKVYNYMAAGLLLTGIVAYAVSTNEQLSLMVNKTPYMLFIFIAIMGMIYMMGSRIETLSVSAIQTMFWAMCALNGLTLTSIFIFYTGASIVKVFFITSTMFAGASLYGYTTKQNLSAMGSFLLLALIGLIVASIVNIFMASPQASWLISFVAVGIFAALIAYDHHRLKQLYSQSWSKDLGEKIGVYGALMLYLDFIGMFRHLLVLLGDRRD